MHKRTHVLFKLFFVFALLFAGLPGAALAQSSDSAAAQDIVAIAAGNPDFSTLVTLVTKAELVDALMADGPYTVFAPTNDAFAKVPQEVLDALLADPDLLKQVLLYHVVAGKVMAADVKDGASAATLQGEPVTFKVADGKVAVNDANVVSADIEAKNGVIHVIDSVIVPAAVLEALTKMSAAAATPAATEAAVAAPAAAPVAAEKDIVDTAVGAGSFNTLVALVKAAGLVDALKADGPFTVFAPTDEAFAKLPQAQVDALLADPKGALTQILLYHVVPGKVMAADVKDGAQAATLQGEPITFSVMDGKVMANAANVVAADVAATNGVIHVIDSVILPPSVAAAAAAAPAATEAMPAATEAAPAAAASEQAPEQMPVTGGESNSLLVVALMTVLLMVIGGAALVSRRRMA